MKLFRLKLFVALVIFTIATIFKMATGAFTPPPPPGPGTQTLTSMTSIYNSGTQQFYIFKPYDYTSGTHPLIIFLQGQGEVGNTNLTSNGIADLCSRGATMRFQNPVDAQFYSYYVITPIKPSGGGGAWETFRVKDVLAWARANLANMDTTRVYLTGLSLGGGGTWAVVADSVQFMSKFAAFAPIAPTDDGDRTAVINNIAATGIPFWDIHSVDDNNTQTHNGSSSQYYQFYLGQNTTTKKWTYYSPTTLHSGCWQKGYDTGHTTYQVDSSNSFFFPYAGSTTANFLQNPNLYEWLLSKQRTASPNPSSNAGSDQTIQLPTNSTTLTGSGTPVGSATISSYAWTKKSGPSTYTIGSPTSSSTTVSSLVQGTYIFTLTVTDNNGLTGSDDVQVTVNSSNTPPTANAGSNQTITLPTSSCTLDGTGSSDPDGSIASYSWGTTSGPNTPTIVTPTTATTSVTGLIQGVYVFTLTVTDNLGATGSASTTVTVNPASVGYYGMDSITITFPGGVGTRNFLIKRPTEDPAYTPIKKYPLLFEFGDQDENLQNNPSGLVGLMKHGTPSRLKNGLPIYPVAHNGSTIYYIMAKMQPLNYGDFAFADGTTQMFNAITGAYPIDTTTKYTDGRYKYVMLAGTERGADAIYSTATWSAAIGFGGSTPPAWVYKVKKIVTSWVSNVNNGSAAAKTPSIYSSFVGRSVRFFEPTSTNTVPQEQKDSASKFSNAYQRLFRASVTRSQMYDSMFSVLGTDSSTNMYRLLVDDPGTPPPPNYICPIKDIYDFSGYAQQDPNTPWNYFDGSTVIDPKNGVISYSTTKGNVGYKWDTTVGGPTKIYDGYFLQNITNIHTFYPGKRGCRIVLDLSGAADPLDTTKKFKLTDIYAYNATFDGGYTMYFYNFDKVLRQSIGQRWKYIARPDSLLVPFDSITTTSTPSQWINKVVNDSMRYMLIRLVKAPEGKTAEFSELCFYGAHQYDTSTVSVRPSTYAGVLPSKKTAQYTFGKSIGTNWFQGQDLTQSVYDGAFRVYTGNNYFDVTNAPGVPATYDYWPRAANTLDMQTSVIVDAKARGKKMWFTNQGSNLYNSLNGNPEWNIDDNGATHDPENPAEYLRAGDFAYNFVAKFGNVAVSSGNTKFVNDAGFPNGQNIMDRTEFGNEVEAHGASYMASFMKQSMDYDGHNNTLGVSGRTGGKNADPNFKVLSPGSVEPDTNMVKTWYFLAKLTRADGKFPADGISFHKYFSNRDSLPIGNTFSFDVQIGQHSESAELAFGTQVGLLKYMDRVARNMYKYVDTSLHLYWTENGRGNYGSPARSVQEAGAVWDIYNTPPFGVYDSLQAKAILSTRNELLTMFTPIAEYNEYAVSNQYGDPSNNHYQLFYSYGRAAGRTGAFAFNTFFPFWWFRANFYSRLSNYYPDSILLNGGSSGAWQVKFRNATSHDSVCYVAWKGSYDGSAISNKVMNIGSLVSANLTKVVPLFTNSVGSVSTIVASGNTIVDNISEMPVMYFAQETPSGTSVPPVAIITMSPDTVITLNTNTINLTALSSFDPDGTIVGWQWTKTVGGAANIQNPTSNSTAVGSLTKGIYVFQLVVTDNSSLTGTTTKRLTVLPLGTTSFREIGTLVYQQGDFLKIAYNVKVAKNALGQAIGYFDYTANVMYDPTLIYTKFYSTK